MRMGIPNVLRVKFTSQRFLNQISSFLYINYLYMLAFCCGDPALRTSHIESRLNIVSTTLWCWCTWGFQLCFGLRSHLKDFWIKSVDYPYHIVFKILLPVTINLYVYIYIYILAFCCEDPTLRTSRIELRLNIDLTTLWCWCAWGVQMCFGLSSHLQDFWIKSIDYSFHIGFKIGWQLYIHIFI